MARKDILPERKLEYRCTKCGRTDLKAASFYKSPSTLFSNNGCLPICKDCLAQVYNKYLLSFQDVHKAVKRVCMAFDIYYSDQIVDACLVKTGATTPSIGDYIKKLNLTTYKRKTFDNSIDEMFMFDTEEDNVVIPVPKEEQPKPLSVIPDSVRIRWGSGLSDNDYKMLEEHYKYLKKANPDFDSNQEIFIMDLCQIKMQQTRAMMSGRTDDYIKLTESYRKTFAQAGLKTVKESASDDDFSFGLTAQMIEQYSPAEYYKDKERYKDFDGLGDYITRLLTRPLKNLMFGTTDRDYEYYVKDDEDIIEDE